MAIKIAVAAVGTRGDVQPLLSLAAAVKEALCHEADVTVTLITHAAHQVWSAEAHWGASAVVAFQLLVLACAQLLRVYIYLLPLTTVL